MRGVKNSVGIWTFSANATCFIPAVAFYEVVYKALALDDQFIQNMYTARKKSEV
jgi:hypothetical protein